MQLTGILYAFADETFCIGNDIYKQTIEPTDTSISVAVIEPIRVYPTDDSEIVTNNMGHYEGDVSAIEQYQSEKLEKTIASAKELRSLLLKVKRVMYFDLVTDGTVKNRIPSNDYIVCAKHAISELTNAQHADRYNIFVFEMYEEGEYVGKNIIENWPFMLLLQATYHELVTYLKSIDLYENRWPFNHVWQNGIEFAQMLPIVTTESFRIWSLGYFQSFNGLYVRDNIIPALSKDDHVLIMDWGSVFPASALLISKANHPKNMYWCANGIEEKDSLRSMNVQAFLVSHNAFISNQVFDIRKQEKTYNAIFNQSLIPFKRPSLASSVDGVVYTSGSPPAAGYADMIRRQKNSMVKINSNPYEIADLINRSRCGLALSQAEGGNYATSEYLLCGVPVVTTRNIGGRDAFLDTTNSVYCEDDTPESVEKSVRYILENPDKFDPVKIRQNTLKKNDEMLATLKTRILYPIFAKYGLADPKQIDNLVSKALSNSNPNSKGRTVFQPEFSKVVLR